MSTHRVDVTVIGEVMVHPNADRLELAKVGDTDWQVVVGKGQFMKGDPCIYIPIDSVLEPKLEEYLFPPGSKVTLSKHRVRSIKLRGALSQGMVIQMNTDLSELFPDLKKVKLGQDVSELIGVTTYEPPAQSTPGMMRGQQTSHNNPQFTKYTDIENWKHYPHLFEPDEYVYVTEKIHGTSVRYGNLPVHVNTFMKRVKRFLRILPTHEFCFGSRNVQLQSSPHGKQYYSKNVYSIIADQLDLRSKLQPGESLYGEIVGHGIQKGYEYGCAENEWMFYAYDVKVDGKYLDVAEFKVWCLDRGVLSVPLLEMGKRSVLDLDKLRSGPSTITRNGKPVQAVREGIVVKPLLDSTCYVGRKVLKFLNDDYLLKDQTDFH